MTLTELRELCEKLEKAGYGNCDMLKSKDDEGNDFTDIDELSIHNAIFYDYEVDLIDDEDLDELEEDGIPYEKVIVLW